MDTSKFKGHTPGPWAINYKGDVITDSQPGEVHLVVSYSPMQRVNKHIPSQNAMAANAALIAAAPDMLAEVERLRVALSRLHNATHDACVYINGLPPSKENEKLLRRMYDALQAAADALDTKP